MSNNFQYSFDNSMSFKLSIYQIHVKLWHCFPGGGRLGLYPNWHKHQLMMSDTPFAIPPQGSPPPAQMGLQITYLMTSHTVCNYHSLK